MKHLILLLISLISFDLFSQSLNTELKEELDSIRFLDQAVRELMQSNITDQRKAELLEKVRFSEEEFYGNPWGIIQKQDAINQQKVMDIISQYGYPGKSLVGEPTNTTAWYVIQHSEYIEKYLPLIIEAGEAGEIPMKLVVMMEDRHLMQNGKEQIYGTQSYGEQVTDETTGKKEWVYVIWPIESPETVNERREIMGFSMTIEEYASKMGIEYKVLTLEQVKDLFNK